MKVNDVLTHNNRGVATITGIYNLALHKDNWTAAPNTLYRLHFDSGGSAIYSHRRLTELCQLSYISLTHNCNVKPEAPSHPLHNSLITFKTVRGVAREQGEDPEQAHAHRHVTAFTMLDPTVVSANYDGKQKELDKRTSDIADATPLRENQTVNIEGEDYRVHIIERPVADPIHFIPIN